MWVLVGVEIFVIILFFLLGWSIRYQEAYWLISGFATRPEDEQQQLVQNGFPQKTGGLLMGVAIGMALLLPLHFLDFTYVIEVQFGFMIFGLLGGLIYLSKYEVPKKRKRSYIISTAIFLAISIFLIVLSFIGYKDFDLITKESSFEITGVYGDKWKIEDIKELKLMEEMPEVKWKENGFGVATMAKGHFHVDGYGSSLLFIHKDSPPYLYIRVKDKNIFVNGKSPEQTQEWYNKLKNTKVE
jgi:hypothetical protein